MRNKNYGDFASGTLAHIYNRGNNKEKIFFDEQDYRAFLYRIAIVLGFKKDDLKNEDILNCPNSRIRIEPENKKGFKIHSFCLMPNHFHLLVEQCGDIPISRFISKFSISYVMYINKKYKRVGHLFQDQYKSNLVEDNEQLMWLIAYIHMNPVKDGFVKSPELYKWSSFNYFRDDKNLSILTKDLILELFGDQKSFEQEVLNYYSKEDPFALL